MSRNKIRVPISLERTNPETTSYFLSPKKGLLLALSIIPGIIYVPALAASTPGRATGLLMGLITYAVMMITFARIFIFEEPKWKKLFRDLEKNKISNYKYFWGIDRIDSSGVIHYKYSGGNSLRKGVVIKLIRSTRVGKDETYEEDYREAFRRVLKMIFRKGVKVDIYESLDDKSVPHNILMMNKKVKNIEDELTRKIAMEHISNLALIAKSSKRIEITHLVLYFDNPKLFKDIARFSEDVKSELQNSKNFKITKILNKSEVEKFIAHTLNISALPSDEGTVDVNPITEYGEITRVFDEDGYEEWLENLVIPEEPQRLRRIRNKDEDRQPEEKLETRGKDIKGLLGGLKGRFTSEVEGDVEEFGEEDWNDTYDEYNTSASLGAYRDEYEEPPSKKIIKKTELINLDFAAKPEEESTKIQSVELKYIEDKEGKDDLIDLDSIL